MSFYEFGRNDISLIEFTPGRIFAGTVLKIIYDKDIADMNDDYVLCAQEAMGGLSLTSVLGIYWMDYFPFLKYIPSWVPGTQAGKLVKHYTPYSLMMRDKPFEEVQQYKVLLYVSDVNRFKFKYHNRNMGTLPHR